MRCTHLVALTLGTALLPGSLAAQDVEMLGRRYGTRPPDGYFLVLERDPDAFRFKRGRSAALRAGSAVRGFGAVTSGPGAPALALGPRSGPVVGDVFIPVVMGLFSDSPSPAYTAADVQDGYFGPQQGTVSDYYTEVSNDSLNLVGDVLDWVTASQSESEVAGGQSGLVGPGTANFIKELLAQQGGLDWGAYDNDGPDGIPNSLDDDGFVDALAVMHPSSGGECGGSQQDDRIWSHKWSLSEATGSSFTTSTPAAGGGLIRVDDYFIQGLLSCGGSALNPIGVFTHETGHAFGLPDLYDTRSSAFTHAGAGFWDLMASGTWGCTGATPARPCHMGAWSKAQLGWVDVTTLPPDTDFGVMTLAPVETTGSVYRVDAGDGSGEYFLLENRQRLGYYDRNLLAEGLLVWQIDADLVSSRWASNTVNARDHMGVWLRQADGLDELGQTGGGRGDAGDPFPGLTSNSAFHGASNPSATSFEGSATGLTIIDIVSVGADDIDFRLLTSFTTLTLSASTGAAGLFTVDGNPVGAPPGNIITTAPFLTHSLVAAPGEPVGPGERRPFVQWSDAPAEGRTRVVTAPLVDTDYVAEYSGIEYELQVTLTGGVNGVAPGTVSTTPQVPDFWFEPGTDLQVSAQAQTGFSFLDWTGDLAGLPNPASMTMDGARIGGADFEVIYATADVQVALTATVREDLQLEAENGSDPVTWVLVDGALPEGVALASSGSLWGAAVELGTFPVTVEATDALGLTATATVTLDVGPPAFPIGQLASTFLLGGPPLSAVQLNFLDRQGNGDGVYDLGDFRAWVLANPSLPLSADLADAREPRILVLPMRLERPGEAR